MPIYVYRFSDGETTEVWQSFTDDAYTELDGRPVKRVLSAPQVGWQGKSPALEDFWQSGETADIPKRPGGAR